MSKRNLIIQVLFGCCASIMAQSLTMSNAVFTCKYSPRLQIPTETRWQINKSDLGKTKREASWRFISDVPTPFGVATHDSYKNSGFHRGHMCPAADRSCSRAYMKETFRMSNVCPQYPAVNTGAWKISEDAERKLAVSLGSVRVLAMPLFFEKDTIWIGNGAVAVPHAFLKIIYDVNPDTIYKIYFVWNKK